jgi:hypothetical protein
MISTTVVSEEPCGGMFMNCALQISHLCETEVLQQVNSDHDSSRCARCALNRLITDIGFILRGDEK